jgi:hypothetical protein
MGVDRTCVLAVNPSAQRICASVVRRRASHVAIRTYLFPVNWNVLP